MKRANRHPFAVFDIDGTLIRWQLYHALADTLAKRGFIDARIFDQVRESRRTWKRRTSSESFKDYEKHLIQTFDQVITKLKPSQFEVAVNEVFDEYKDQVYVYTRDLIEDLKTKGYLLFAISGSQIEIVSKIARYYGFDDCVGSSYEVKGGKFTGRKLLTVGSKDKILRGLIKKHDADQMGSVAVGDSESDIEMLSMVEEPIAFNPTQKLFAHAKERGWVVVVERKNMIYKLERKGGSYRLTN